MKVLIIEDEELAVTKLAQLVGQYDPTIQILGNIDSVEESVEWLQNNNAPDLLFLDIHLSDGASFEILDKTKVECPVIFTTAYDQYAINAFKTKSVDYLLKPIIYADLKRALDKYHSMFAKNQTGFVGDIKALTEILKNKVQQYKNRFLVKLGNSIKSISVEEVSYFLFEDRTTLLVKNDGRRYPINYTADGLEMTLDPLKFIRANRKFIISIHSIENIYPYFKGRLKLQLSPKQDAELVISAERTKQFKQWLDQ